MEVNGKTFSVGADPEIFVSKMGEFISAHNLVPGTKRNPHKVNKGAVQVDGMALEFNIDPCLSDTEFDSALTTVMSQLKEMVPDCEFMDSSSVIFSEKFLESVPEFALELGCEPDYNGWTLDENVKPNGAALMRTAGGHVHIGGFETDQPFNSDHFLSSARLSRILDETLGLPSLLWDQDDQRRQMYGKGGSFRPKKYGMEYRTLSNKWLFNPLVRFFIFDGVKTALNLWCDPLYEPMGDVREVLDNSDRSSKLFKSSPYVQKAQQYLGV